MKSILVIGMGNFGKHLAEKLLDLGNDVMIIDKDEKIITELASRFTEAYTGDCTKENIVKSLGVNNFDVCFVTTGSSFQSSLEITSLLKEFGAKYIVSKATQDRQAKFLLQIGADEIVYPEKDMAEKLAVMHNATNVFDYIDLGDEHALYEVQVPEVWIGKSLLENDVRKKYNLNVIAIKKANSKIVVPSAEYMFERGDHIMLIGKEDEVKATSKKLKRVK